jgi:hypothetical protein
MVIRCYNLNIPWLSQKRKNLSLFETNALWAERWNPLWERVLPFGTPLDNISQVFHRILDLKHGLDVYPGFFYYLAPLAQSFLLLKLHGRTKNLRQVICLATHIWSTDNTGNSIINCRHMADPHAEKVDDKSACAKKDRPVT